MFGAIYTEKQKELNGNIDLYFIGQEVKEKDGFVYKDEWWTSWILEKPFSDTKGLKEHILKNIEDLQVYPSRIVKFIPGLINLQILNVF